jgi:hypothetical protein
VNVFPTKLLSLAKQLVYRIFGKCEMCGRWFQYPKQRRMNTAYHNEEDNYIDVCLDCYAEIESYWEERWNEYYSSRL